MKKASKVLALILSVLMIASLAACGQSSDPPAGTSAPPTGAGSTPPADDGGGAGEKMQLTFSFWGAAEENQANIDNMEVFNNSQDRIEVSPMFIPWETYSTELNTMATAGQLPDAGMVKEGEVLLFNELGLLNDPSSLYPPDNAPLPQCTFTSNGETVAYALSNEALILFYNKDMFDAASIPYPANAADGAYTWDEFVEVAKQLTLDANGNNAASPDFDPENIVQYGAMVENLAWQLEAMVLSNGGAFYDDNGVAINSPAAIEAIQRVADLYLVHHVAPLSTGTTDDGLQRGFSTGQVAMLTNGTWNQLALYDAEAGEHIVNYGEAVMPYMQEKVTLTTSGGGAVFSQTEHPEEAMEFLRWWGDPENNWGNIANGVWMPNMEVYYTDPAMTEKWLNNPAYLPMDECQPVLVDYVRDYAVPASWFDTPNTGDFNDLLTSILGTVWTGEQTAAEVIEANYDALVAAHEGL